MNSENSRTFFGNSFEENLSTYNNQIVSTMKEISGLVDKGTSRFLVIIGTSLFFLIFIFKIKRFGLELSFSEFIVLIIVATIFILAGACLILYQYKYKKDVIRELRQDALEMLQRSNCSDLKEA